MIASLANRYDNTFKEEEVMKYPVDFVKKVKEVYPTFKALHEALDKGSEFVGRYLADSSSFSMSPARIVDAFEQGREQYVLTDEFF